MPDKPDNVVKVLTSIRELPGSNLSKNTSYLHRGFVALLSLFMEVPGCALNYAITVSFHTFSNSLFTITELFCARNLSGSIVK
jgi:hypothetical protein